MCAYCCGGTPVNKRGEAHRNCPAVCFNAPVGVGEKMLRAQIEALAAEYERDGRPPVIPSHFTYLVFAKRLRATLGEDPS